MQRWRNHDPEAGSLMMAIFMTAVLTGLAGLMLATTLSHAKTTQHDQKYTDVLPAADAAISRGLFMLNHGLTPPTSSSPGQQVYGNQVADWYATAQTNTSAPPSYLLTATTQGLTRTLKAEAFQTARFPVAAFADKAFVLRGGNAATSYDSDSGTRNNTSKGVVASNGSVTIGGGATADGVKLYNWASDPNSARCSGTSCSSLTTVDTALDITSATATQFIYSGLAACGTQTAFTSSAAPSHALPSGTWCASSLNLDVDTTVTGPTVIYVSGNVTTSHHITINYSSSAVPVPSNLQIYMLGSTYDMSNHTTIAGAIYAPLATCSGGAQSIVWGSLICRSISNVGGWQFHYDEALGRIGMGDFRLRNFREN
jgi:hypothetical protein